MSASAILSELQAARADILSLKAQVSALQTALDSKPAAAAAAPSEGKKTRKTRPKNADAAPRPPTPWVIFVDRVRDILRAVKKDDGSSAYTGQDLGIICVQFASALKEENADLSSWSDADIIARRVAWVRPTVSKQEAAGKNKRKTGGSVAGSAAADELDGDADGAASAAPSADSGKKKRGPAKGTPLTAEQKAARAAKSAATRAAKKAVSAGLLDDEAGGASAAEIAAAAALMKKTKVSVSNAAASAAPAAAGAGPAAAGGSAPPSDEFKNVLLNKERYLVNMANGHAYNVVKDAEGVPIKGDDGKYMQSTWAGIFHRKGGMPSGGAYIDSSVPEPSAAEEDEEEENFDE